MLLLHMQSFPPVRPLRQRQEFTMESGRDGALAATFVLATANAYVQVAAAWFTVNVWPPAVIVPLRASPAGFTSNV